MTSRSGLAEALLTSRSAIFYQRDGKISREAIETYLRECLESIGPEKVIELTVRKRSKSLGGSYSLAVFLTNQAPTFLNNSSLVDQVHGFILLIERDKLAAVLSKHACSPDKYLPTAFERIGYAATLGLFAGDGATYESISLRTLGSGRGGLLRRAYDAADLKAVMPRAGARRSAPSALKVRQGDATSRLAPGTSRVSQQGGRADLEALFEFVRGIEAELVSSTSSTFLAAFAQPVELSNLDAAVKPTSLLIHWNEIDDLRSTAELQIWDADETLRELTDAEEKSLYELLTAELSLVDNSDGTFGIIDSGGSELGTVNRAKSKFTIASDTLAKYAVVQGNEAASLERKLSAEQLFTVGFSDPSYSYTASTVLRNQKLPEELSSFLSCFVALPGLASTSSEKGNLASSSTSFSPHSVFGVIEEHVIKDDALVICDDLNEEWADHIVLSGSAVPAIEFIHSKWSEGPTTSASAFHDVASQATKNLGNLSVDAGFADKCHAKWDTTYNGIYKKNGVATAIKRIRSSHSASDCELLNARLRQNIGTQLWMSLAVSFLSKSELEEQAAKFSAGGNVKANVIQLLWILASFIDICRANGVQPRVYCAP